MQADVDLQWHTVQKPCNCLVYSWRMRKVNRFAVDVFFLSALELVSGGGEREFDGREEIFKL